MALEPGEVKTHHDFFLTTPLKYARDGDRHEATFVRLEAPTSRHSDECSFLKQAFFLAAQDQEGSDEEVGDGKEVSEDAQILGMIAMLAQSSRVELPQVFRVARKLFTSGVALVEGEAKLTSNLLDKMSQDDFERMLGAYLVNFTAGSLMRRTGADSSA